jgi:hypothetical protein
MSQTFPFGNPDGSRSDIKEVVDEFVTFDDIAFGGGLGIKPEDLSVRVIVGAKGSGKTVYLRRLQAAASADPSLYVDAIQQDLPNTSNIVRFCQCFGQSFLTEKWIQLWYCAVIRSLVSHLLHARDLSVQLTVDQKTELACYIPHLIPEFRRPISVYSQVVQIINSFNTDHQYSRYFDDPGWAELEGLLAEIIRSVSPIYFFIDSVDEEYANAPMFWLRCQQGLFYRTMRFLRDARMGGRLHVIVCLRDHAISSILMGEHANRYRDEPHIRPLNWDGKSAQFFLEQKLSRLPEAYFMKPKGGGTLVEKWLGTAEIENLGRGISEDILSYILRHTRLLPRDIVILGNHLCNAILATKEKGGTELPQARIRQCVRERAIAFGNEQLAICANQIVSSSMPKEATRKEFVEIYTGDSEYRRGVAERLKDILRSIGKDRFSGEELQTASLLARQEFGETSDAFSVLWQNRLLGFTDTTPEGARQVFFSERNMDFFILPLDREEYLLHSCLIDSVGVRAIGNIPVGVEEAW